FEVPNAYDGSGRLEPVLSIDQTKISGWGWTISILPQLEEGALFEQFRPGFEGPFFTGGVGGGIGRVECRAAMQQQLPVLQCPSDDSVLATSADQYQWIGIEVALTSYKGVIG